MNKKMNKKKILILVTIVLIIVLSVVFSILYTKNVSVRSFFDEYIFRKNITENTLPKIYIGNGYSFGFNDNIVYLEKGVLTFYNKSADKLASLDLDISEPIFASSGKFLCIAEKSGNKIYLISNRSLVWQKEIDGKISSISINSNGYITASISDTTYRTICKVFDVSGSELLTTYHAKSYVISSTISNDNKFLALAEADFSGITIQSSIRIISIDKALSNSSDTIEYNYLAPIGDLIINIKYCNGSLVCLYDNHIDIIKDNSVSEVVNFKVANILFADINNKLIQIEKISTGLLSSKFELQILDIPSLEKKVYILDKEPKSIEVFGNIIAVNFGTEILFINNYGWLIKDYTSYQEVQSIMLSNNLASIVYKDKIEFLSL